MSAKNYLGEAGLTELITNCNEELKKKLDQLDYYSESSETATLDPKTLDIQSSTITITTPLRNTNATIDGVTGGVSLSSADTLTLDGAVVDISGEPVRINDTTIVVDAHYATYNDDEIATVSAIPTATSELTNDSGFITEELIELAGYVTQTELDVDLSSKQNSLKYYSEGTNEATINTRAIALEASFISIGAGGILELNGTTATLNAAKIATEDDLSTKLNILTAGTGIAITEDGNTISCTYNDVINELTEAVNSNITEIESLSDTLTDTTNDVSSIYDIIGDLRLEMQDNTSDIYSLTESKQDKLTAGTGIDITNNTISCTLDTTVFEIVESLPTSDIDVNKIYVVPADTTGEQNLYIEYIYVNDAWEKMGEFKADTDLSNYYTKSETNELISVKADKDDVYTKDEIDTITYDRDYIDEVIQDIHTDLDSKLKELKYYTESDGSGSKGIVSLTANMISIDTNEQDTGTLRIESGDVLLSSTNTTINSTSVDIESSSMIVTGDVIVTGSMYVNKGEVITTKDNIIYSTAVLQIVLVDALPSNPSSTTLYLIPE